jgi:hypothetical protein
MSTLKGSQQKKKIKRRNEEKNIVKEKTPKAHLKFPLSSHTPLLNILLQSADRILHAPHVLDFFTGMIGGPYRSLG